MKKLFILFILFLFKRTIKISIYDNIGEYFVDGIEVSQHAHGEEKIRITLSTRKTQYYIDH